MAKTSRGGQILGHPLVMACQEATRYLFFVPWWGVAFIVPINHRAAGKCRSGVWLGLSVHTCFSERRHIFFKDNQIQTLMNQ